MAYQSTTLKALRQQVGTELGLQYVIPNADFTAVAASSISSLRRLANPNWGPGYWAGLDAGVFRPDAASAADYWRFADQLTNASGLLTVSGTYADQTVGTEVAELWKRAGTVYQPHVEILGAINYCLQFEMFTTMAAVSDLGNNDGDMASTGVTSWTASSATLTKISTADSVRIPYGMRSLRVLNTGASGYAQSATVAPTGATVGTNEMVKAWAIVSTAAQTSLVDFRDLTNATSIASMTTTEVDPQLVHIPWRPVPSGCVGVALRVGGASASSDVYVNGEWIYRQSALGGIRFPSYASESFKVKQLFYGRPTGPAFTSGLTTTYPALSMEFNPLIEGADFEWLVNQSDANPYGIQLNRDARWYKEWPLFIEVRRPFSDLGAGTGGTFTGTSETETTAAPLHTLVPRVKLYLLDHVLIPGYPGDANWLKLRAIAAKELQDAQSIRTPEPTARIQTYFAGVGRV